MMQGTHWRTPLRSGNQGNCVEVRPDDREVAVRDTKNRDAGHFTVTHESWTAFTNYARTQG
ncbi:DUF397 domain-containing protein [Amycolatopsis sp. FDAARGOS 1241]|nr:DUF397 domain-containing protein [Amycolatopsis sp. FDAARGOS 1241]